jgi:hypothetical protein
MKLRDEIKDWIIPSLLLTPHAILLATVVIIESEQSNSSQAISSFISMIANMATAIGVLWAIYTANNWRKSLIDERKIQHFENLLGILISASEQHKNIIETQFQPVAISLLDSTSDSTFESDNIKLEVCKSIFNTVIGKSQDEYYLKLRDLRLELAKEIKSSFIPNTEKTEQLLNAINHYMERLFKAYSHLSVAYISGNSIPIATLSNDQEIIENIASGTSSKKIDNLVNDLKLEFRQSLGLHRQS